MCMNVWSIYLLWFHFILILTFINSRNTHKIQNDINANLQHNTIYITNTEKLWNHHYVRSHCHYSPKSSVTINIHNDSCYYYLIIIIINYYYKTKTRVKRYVISIGVYLRRKAGGMRGCSRNECITATIKRTTDCLGKTSKMKSQQEHFI